jgi:hypothetical protein
MFIPPGSPWENPFIESFNGRLWDELLNGELFTSLREAEVLLKQFVTRYNEFRPQSSLGCLTPKEFGARYEAPEIASASPDGQGARPASGGAPAQAATIERNGVQWIEPSIQTFKPQPRPDEHFIWYRFRVQVKTSRKECFGHENGKKKFKFIKASNTACERRRDN